VGGRDDSEKIKISSEELPEITNYNFQITNKPQKQITNEFRISELEFI
jgi:hypothetical protein